MIEERDGSAEAAFRLGDVAIPLHCPDPADTQLIGDLWCDLFAIERAPSPSPAPTLHFRFGNAPSRPTGEPVSRTRDLSVWKTAKGFFLQCGDTTLDLDQERGVATGALAPDFPSIPLAERRELFLLAFLMLLTPHGRHGLHANGVVDGGLGCLIVGPPGHGKTTLALSLIRAGWSFVADDALLLRRTETAVTARALRRGFSCTKITAERFPELKERASELPGAKEGKEFVAVDAVYPGRFVPGCRPRLLLFPSVAEEEHTRLEPVGETGAMARLLEQSPGVLADRVSAARQMEVLRALLDQSARFRILLGADVYEEPGIVARLVREAV